MARVTKIVKVPQPKIPPRPPLRTPRKITLELTEGEADFLLGMCGFVGGEGNGPRKYARRIQHALTKGLGYDVPDSDAFKLGIGVVEFLPYGSPRPTVDQLFAADVAVANALKVTDTTLEDKLGPDSDVAATRQTILKMFDLPASAFGLRETRMADAFRCLRLLRDADY